MASNTNNSLLSALRGPWPNLVNDNIFIATGVVTQAAATAVARSGANRVVTAPAGGAILLPSMLNEDEAADIVFIINDALNSINVFPAPGETMLGVANAAFAVAAGAFGFFLIKAPNVALPMQSVQAITSVYDWRAAVIT
jgi:hypothetical protein